MRQRIALEIVLIAGGTLVLAYAVLGGIALLNSSNALETFVDQVPRVLFGLLGVGLALWAVIVVVGAIVSRRRAAGWHILTHLTGIVVAMIVNAAVLMIVAALSGGELLLAGIAAAAGFVVVLCSVPVILITKLIVLRPRPGSPTLGR
ncbi:MAG: hypothetical protein JJE28_03820 [Actinomycetales bacterium]|nr:hypothetical protein [Actinomycetales bacterium]